MFDYLGIGLHFKTVFSFMTNKRNMSTYAKKKDENQADASNHLNTPS